MVGDGFRVHNFFPGGYDMDPARMSPFYLLDYNDKMTWSPRREPRGVGVHPHRGFETVTIVYHGNVQHHDSRGNAGTIGPGDIQWMTAGAGILHKEYHEKQFSLQGGLFQVVQLWVNLPAKDKMTAPNYQTILNPSIPRYLLPNGSGEVEVIAGTFKGVKGVASTFTPIEMYNVRLQPKTTLEFDLREDYNTGILVIDGPVEVNDTAKAPEDHFVLFANQGERIVLTSGEKPATLLVLSGKPIDEPTVGYGPFLMNTKQEILQAYADLNAGRFGHLDD